MTNTTATAAVPGAGAAAWPPELNGHAIHGHRIGGVITLPSSLFFLDFESFVSFFI
jgi:hypothetical protein